MNKKKKLLSICIPTYNREKYLKRLINSIVIQESFTDDIEIIINDGPSKDNTTLMIKEYQKKYSNIKYYRNNIAVGMMPAILESISMSNGEYTWIIGSDDVIKENAIAEIKDKINTYSPSLVLCNRNDFIDFNDILLKGEGKGDTKIFNGFVDFSIYLGSNYKYNFGKKSNYFMFMSIFCFNTKKFQESLLDLINDKGDEYYEKLLKVNYFNYVIIIYNQLYNGNKIVLIEKDLVLAQCNNNQWSMNKKIIKDLKVLFTGILNTYPSSNNLKKLFKRIYIGWYLSLYFGWLSKNKYTIYIYNVCFKYFKIFFG